MVIVVLAALIALATLYIVFEVIKILKLISIEKHLSTIAHEADLLYNHVYTIRSDIRDMRNSLIELSDSCIQTIKLIKKEVKKETKKESKNESNTKQILK